MQRWEELLRCRRVAPQRLGVTALPTVCREYDSAPDGSTARAPLGAAEHSAVELVQLCLEGWDLRR